MISALFKLLIGLTAVTLFAPSAFAEKFTEPTPFPMIENELVGISKFGLTSDKNLPWGVCLGTMISARKIITDAHCVTKEVTSKEPNAEISVRRLPFGSKTYTVDAAHIWIHPNYVPGNADGSFQSRIGFDIAIIEVDENAMEQHFPLGRTYENLTAEIEKQESCGVVVYREVTIDKQPTPKWMPIYIPVSNAPYTATESAKGAFSAIASLFGGAPHKAPRDFDTIMGKAVFDIYGGDSGGPVVCRSAKGELTLVGLLRGGGRGKEATDVILQDIYFDKWATEQLQK